MTAKEQRGQRCGGQGWRELTKKEKGLMDMDTSVVIAGGRGA